MFEIVCALFHQSQIMSKEESLCWKPEEEKQKFNERLKENIELFYKLLAEEKAKIRYALKHDPTGPIATQFRAQTNPRWDKTW